MGSGIPTLYEHKAESHLGAELEMAITLHDTNHSKVWCVGHEDPEVVLVSISLV